jgi:hypothetical protein
MRTLVIAVSSLLLAALAPGGSFVDDDGSVHEGSIEAIATEGITRGCNPPVNDRFCPGGPVTRGQMAAFLVRALGLEPAPADFVDLGGSPFTREIGALAEAGITRGCNPPTNDRYCPRSPVTRAAMATFLARALRLDATVPPPRCPTLPADDIWNTPVTGLPVAARSDTYVAAIGADATVHPDFGSGVWPPGSNSPIGIPYVEVGSDTPPVPIHFTAYGDESDPGPYPIPPDAPIEGGPQASGDRHVIVVDRHRCRLYELFSAYPRADGSWESASGAVFDLDSSDLRPDGWTSADAAGLPIFPGLVTYDEVASGQIDHALRFTAPRTADAHAWPARHHAGSGDISELPPMGQRFRLRSDFDTSGFDDAARVIAEAMKVYGIILADNGSSWYISGAPDPRWDNDALHQLGAIRGSDFEAVDVSGLMVDPDSGTAR